MEYRTEHPEMGERFDRAMTDLSRVEIRALLDSYEFGRFGTVVDVGGGHGALLWDDDRATAILRACRQAVPDEAVVLVIERDVGRANEAADVKLFDLNMLVMMGGRERTVEEYGDLLAGAGFRLMDVTPTPAGLSVIQAAPVS